MALGQGRPSRGLSFQPRAGRLDHRDFGQLTSRVLSKMMRSSPKVYRVLPRGARSGNIPKHMPAYPSQSPINLPPPPGKLVSIPSALPFCSALIRSLLSLLVRPRERYRYIYSTSVADDGQKPKATLPQPRHGKRNGKQQRMTRQSVAAFFASFATGMVLLVLPSLACMPCCHEVAHWGQRFVILQRFLQYSPGALVQCSTNMMQEALHGVVLWSRACAQYLYPCRSLASLQCALFFHSCLCPSCHIMGHVRVSMPIPGRGMRSHPLRWRGGRVSFFWRRYSRVTLQCWDTWNLVDAGACQNTNLGSPCAVQQLPRLFARENKISYPRVTGMGT